MAGNKFLQGQLNQPVTRPNYTGGKTDSLEVVVNNSNMTITGNVIWDSFIGTTLGTAYSGADGARNYKAILNLTSELNDTIEQFIEYKTITDSRLVVVENIAETVDADLTTKLDSEITRLKESDKELLDKLIKESQRALATEAEFVHKIETEALLRADLDAELKSELEVLSNSVFDKIYELSTKIDSITTQLKSSETYLIEQITAENIRAIAAEKELQNKINETNRALATLRSEVSNSAESNKEDVTSSLLALANQINDEITRAKQQELNLSNDIDAVNSRVTEVALDVSARIGKVISDYSASDAEIINRVEATSSKHNEDIKNLATRISSVNNAITQLESSFVAETSRIDSSITEAVDNLTVKIDDNTASLKNVSIKHDTDMVEVRKELTSTTDSLTSVIQEESTSRAAEISRLDAEVATIVAAATETDKHVNTLETVVTQLENRSTVSTNEFNRSIESLDAKVNLTDTKLQNAIQAESNRAVIKETELIESIADATAAFEAADEVLDKKIIEVVSQLEELKEATTTSSSNAVVSLDALQQSIIELADSSNNQFSLLNATDEEIEEQLRLLTADVSVLEDQLTVVQRTQNKLTTEVTTLTSKVDTIDAELTDLQTDITSAKNSVVDLGKTLTVETSRAEAAEKVLADKIDTANVELIDTKTRVGVVETKQVSMAHQLNGYNNSISTINNELAKVNSAVDSVKVNFNTETAKTDTAISKIEEKDALQDSQIEELSREVETLQDDVKEQNLQLDSAKDDISHVKSRVTKTEGAISTNASNIAAVSLRVSGLETTVVTNKKQAEDKHTELSTELADHQSLLEEHTGKLAQHETSIVELQNSRKQNNAVIENLYTQLNEEVVARKNEIDLVNIQHAKEARRSSAIDEEHSSRLTNLENNLSATEDRLSSAITIKETESIARDDYLNEKINNNFDILDEALQTATSELSANIFDERGDRADADRALQTQLNTLSTVVTQNNTILSTLGQRVSDEAADVDEYIADNDARVFSVEQSVDILTAESRTHMKTIATESHQVYTQDGSSTIMLPLTQGAESGAIVKRTEAGNIQLPADVTKIGAADAVPKSYVESLINDVKDVLYEEIKNFSFDIIDGGKAPIKK